MNRFLKDFIGRKDIFLGRLATTMKEDGFSIGQKEVEKIYTIATQLFHHLWWDKSKNRSKRYACSRNGQSYEQLLSYYKFLNRFPECLSGLCEELRIKMVERCWEACGMLEIRSMDELKEAQSLIEDYLKELYVAEIERLRTNIIFVKQGNRHWVAENKRKLKEKSIHVIVIPLLWISLVRDFKSAPHKFIAF